jgi:hypothetical protein
MSEIPIFYDLPSLGIFHPLPELVNENETLPATI